MSALRQAALLAGLGFIAGCSAPGSEGTPNVNSAVYQEAYAVGRGTGWWGMAAESQCRYVAHMPYGPETAANAFRHNVTNQKTVYSAEQFGIRVRTKNLDNSWQSEDPRSLAKQLLQRAFRGRIPDPQETANNLEEGGGLYLWMNALNLDQALRQEVANEMTELAQGREGTPYRELAQGPMGDSKKWWEIYEGCIAGTSESARGRGLPAPR